MLRREVLARAVVTEKAPSVLAFPFPREMIKTKEYLDRIPVLVRISDSRGIALMDLDYIESEFLQVTVSTPAGRHLFTYTASDLKSEAMQTHWRIFICWLAAVVEMAKAAGGLDQETPSRGPGKTKKAGKRRSSAATKPKTKLVSNRFIPIQKGQTWHGDAFSAFKALSESS